MGLVEKIIELANRKSITIAELERNIGISNGSISKWRKSSPKTEMLEKVADYFDVSIDDLLGRDDPMRLYRVDIEGLTEDEIEIVRSQLKFAEQIARQQIKERKENG